MKDKYMLPQSSWAFFPGNKQSCGLSLVLWGFSFVGFLKKLTDEVENCIMKTFHKLS